MRSLGCKGLTIPNGPLFELAVSRDAAIRGFELHAAVEALTNWRLTGRTW
jgi:hypothetical protein